MSVINKYVGEEAASTLISKTKQAITAAINNEAAARDTAISNAIDIEVTNRNSAITAAINDEATARDTAISNAIDTEVTNRNSAITAAINDEATARDTAISNAIDAEADARSSADTALSGRITTINNIIPTAATADNKLTDTAYVINAIQTSAANFRGNWNNWSAVPTVASNYPEDSAGNKTPTENDYIIIADAADYTQETLTGAWRFKYTGIWSSVGKAGWIPEYQVNEEPLTPEQLAAVNSGITSTKVSNYDSHISNTNNPHSVTKAQVGLGSVVNTGDSATPVSGGTTKFTTGGAYTELAKKVDKVSGKGLSTNDFTDALETKLNGIEAGAEVNVQSNWTQTDDTKDDFIKNKPTLATVATSGSYNDLSNKPTIPTVDSALSSTSTNPVQNKVINTALNGKVPTTRTVNGHALSANVTVTKSDVGLGNVGNFKAVSTVTSQGLTDTEMANARTNIGVGTASVKDSTDTVTQDSTDLVESGAVASAIQNVTDIASSLPTDAVLHYSFDEVPDYPDGTAYASFLNNNTYDIQSMDGRFRNWRSTEFSNANGNVLITSSADSSGGSGVFIQGSYVTNQIIKIKIKVTALNGTLDISNGKGTNGQEIATYTTLGTYEFNLIINSSAQYPNLYIATRGTNESFTAEVLELYIGDGSYSTPIIDNANGQNNATNNGGIAIQGVSGKAIRLLGNNYIQGNLPWTPYDKGTFTVSCWVKNWNKENGWCDIISNWSNYVVTPLWLALNNTTNASEAIRFDVPNKDDGNILRYYVKTTDLIWDDLNTDLMHVVAVFNASNSALYINGQKINLTFDTAFPLGGSSADRKFFYIGRHANKNNAFIYTKATFDDFLVFDRALSETEVQALYQNKANTPKYFPTPTNEIKQNSLELATSGGVKNAISTAETNAKNLANATGTLAIANGGTNATTADKAVTNLLSATSQGDGDVTDDTDLITSHSSGYTTTNNKFYKRKGSKLWNYISGKISSVLGLTATSYGGNSATATSATNSTNATYSSYLGTSSANYTKSTLDTALSGKVPTTRTVNGHALSADVTVSKSDVGLGSVANTGDSATPVSGGTTKFTTGGAYTELAKKVDKVDGKGLSTNDFTNTDKAAIRYYGTCDTSRATNAKVVTCDNFVLEIGCKIAVKFTDTAGAAPTSGNITLNINSTGAKNVYNKNAVQMTYSHSGEFRASRVCEFTYDGTKYVWLNYDSNSTYSTITQAEITAGTSTSSRLITPKLLADNFVKKESGKGLSTNDFTNTLKTKLNGIESGAQVNTITGVKGDSETSYRTGNVNITKSNIGLGDVGNFKAVSTAANQGLTATEKTNARTNIGAGTSSFSGAYSDLTGKPTIDTAVTSDSSNLITSGAVSTALANKKNTQTAVTDPTASGNATSYIASLSQNTQGVITATKKTIPSASTSTAGITRLSNSYSNTSTSIAVTEKALNDGLASIGIAKLFDLKPLATTFSTSIWAMYAYNGVLFIGLNGAGVWWSRNCTDFYQIDSIPTDKTPTAFIEYKGSLYIGIGTKLFVSIDGNSFTQVTGFPSVEINCFARYTTASFSTSTLNPHDTLLIGTTSGLFYSTNGTSFTQISNSYFPTSYKVNCILVTYDYVSHDGTDSPSIYVGTYLHGLYAKNDNIASGAYQHVSTIPTDKSVLSLCKYKDKVYTYVRGDGIYYLDCTKYTSRPSVKTFTKINTISYSYLYGDRQIIYSYKDILIITGYGNSIFLSADGVNFYRKHLSLEGIDQACRAICSLNDNLYAAFSESLFTICTLLEKDATSTVRAMLPQRIPAPDLTKARKINLAIMVNQQLSHNPYIALEDCYITDIGLPAVTNATIYIDGIAGPKAIVTSASTVIMQGLPWPVKKGQQIAHSQLFSISNVTICPVRWD